MWSLGINCSHPPACAGGQLRRLDCITPPAWSAARWRLERATPTEFRARRRKTAAAEPDGAHRASVRVRTCEWLRTVVTARSTSTIGNLLRRSSSGTAGTAAGAVEPPAGGAAAGAGAGAGVFSTFGSGACCACDPCVASYCRPAPRGVSRRPECHFTDSPFSSTLNHLLKGEQGAAE